MKPTLRTFFIIFSAVFIVYLLLPNPRFPEPPMDSLQSNEPADTETPLRRAYFTNATREQVLIHYTSQLKRSRFANIPLPTYKLNYPPEEAQTLIRNQTRSTFLEEIVHPFRESFFVNGFEPKEGKDTILIADKIWRQKITVRLVPSNHITRLIIVVLGLSLLWIVGKEWLEAEKSLVAKKK